MEFENPWWLAAIWKKIKNCDISSTVWSTKFSMLMQFGPLDVVNH